MLLQISTTHKPADVLSYLLHKHPDKLQSIELSFGKVFVFYPECSKERCTAAIMLDVDPVALVRGKSRTSEGMLEQYVNDRPYVASSFMSVAISQMFRSALNGTCKEMPEMVSQAIPLELSLDVVPCRGGEALARRLFEPLGYEVGIETIALDETFPDWGNSRYLHLKLSATKTLKELLAHIYVLIPVMDNDKHYWVGEDEVEKLLRHGGEWLAAHPEKNLVTDRYLRHKHNLTRDALARLVVEEDQDPDETDMARTNEEEAVEEKISLNEQRLGSVIAVLKRFGAKRIIDMGCGEGKLLSRLKDEREFQELVGMDVSVHSLEIANRRLRLDRASEQQKDRIKLMQGSLTYKDKRLSGFDAATCIEVVEHLDPPRLEAFQRTIFEYAKPKVVVLTTPNSEYNVRFESLPAGVFRHRDHRFEWNRKEFQDWANQAAERFGYGVEFLPVGQEDKEVGAPTQMGVFILK